MSLRDIPLARAMVSPISASIILLGLYQLTAPGTILFGDGLEFTAVAHTLGVAHPPGYPLFTLLGWLWLQGNPGYGAYEWLVVMNVVFGAGTAVALGYVADRLLAHPAFESIRAGYWWLGWGVALMTGSALALWDASTVVEVYAFSAFLTALILLLLCGERFSRAAYVGAAALLGCVAANHLPAMAILLPIVGAALDDQERRRDWVAHAVAAAVFVATAAFWYGTLMARTGGDAPAIHWGAPQTIPALWTHATGGEYGQFLLLQERPGVLFSLETWFAFAFERLGLFVGSFDAQFGFPLFGLNALALVGFGAAGALLAVSVARWRVLGLLAAVAAQTGFLFVYKIPDAVDYVLGILVGLTPLVTLGLLAALVRIAREEAERPRILPVPILVFAAGVLTVILSVIGNHRVVDRSSDLSAELWLSKALEKSPKGAVILTHGDADTYALWYAQIVEGRRTDLLVVGANFLRFPWFRGTMADHPLRDQIAFVEGPPGTLNQHIAAMDRQAIQPALRAGAPLVTTSPDPFVLDRLGMRYRLEPIADLLDEATIVRMIEQGNRAVPPERLLRILPPDPPTP